MNFVVNKKKLHLKKLGIGIALVLIGVVVGVIGVLVILVQSQPDSEELEAIRLQDTVEYITKEQERLGINCGALSSTIQSFMRSEVMPALSIKQPGRNWIKEISENGRKQMGELRDNYFACGRLYRAAQNGKWDGFKSLRYTVELDREIIVMNTLIRFQTCNEQDAACFDQSYRQLLDAVRKIEKHLKNNEK